MRSARLLDGALSSQPIPTFVGFGGGRVHAGLCLACELHVLRGAALSLSLADGSERQVKQEVSRGTLATANELATAGFEPMALCIELRKKLDGSNTNSNCTNFPLS